jgi:hypothetical protein
MSLGWPDFDSSILPSSASNLAKAGGNSSVVMRASKPGNTPKWGSFFEIFWLVLDQISPPPACFVVIDGYILEEEEE